jgi:hypothetical protein
MLLLLGSRFLENHRAAQSLVGPSLDKEGRLALFIVVVFWIKRVWLVVFWIRHISLFIGSEL